VRQKIPAKLCERVRVQSDVESTKRWIFKSWQKKAMNINFSVFSNHHTIIGGYTAPASDAWQFIVELARILLYHYVVLYQDSSGNEQRALSSILSYYFKNKGGKNFASSTITNVSPRILILNLSDYWLISIGKQVFEVLLTTERSKTRIFMRILKTTL